MNPSPESPIRTGRLGRTPTLLGLLAVAIMLAVTACEPQVPFEGLSTEARRGWREYRGRCSACHHHRNPHHETTVAPAIARASLELLRAKVLRGEYPDGYQPKRTSRNMTTFPYLGERMVDLAAFLAEVPEPPGGTK